MNTFDHIHKFPSLDGLELLGIFSARNHKACVIQTHGLASRCYSQSYHAPLASMYDKHGYDYFSFNNRGCEYIKGYSDLETDEKVHLGYTFERFEDCVHDVEGAVRYLETLGYERFILQGHSSGCQKVLTTLHNNQNLQERVDHTILLSPCDDIGLAAHWEGKEGWEAKKAQAWESPDGTILPPSFVFHAYISKETFLSHFGEGTLFDSCHYHDRHRPFEELEDLSMPSLALFGSDDLIVNKQDIDEVYDSLALIDLTYLEGANHSYGGKEQELAAAIDSWLTLQKNNK